MKLDAIAEVLADEDNLREGTARGGVTLVDELEIEAEELLDDE